MASPSYYPQKPGDTMDYANTYEVPQYSSEVMQSPAPNQLQWVPASSSHAAINTGNHSKKYCIAFSIGAIIILAIAMAALILGVISYNKEVVMDYSECLKDVESCTVLPAQGWNQIRYFCVTENLRINVTVSELRINCVMTVLGIMRCPTVSQLLYPLDPN